VSDDRKNARDGDALARQVGNAMFAADAASRSLGMQIIAISPGYAKLSMQVCADMLNGHGIMHGGLTFTLADSAFAFACNSYNINTVAAGCSIEFLRAGKLGETLTAEAKETLLQGRHGIYDVTVTGEDGTLVAVFRGKSTQIKGTVLPTTG
jgi:acyl-CoA thioesterase